MRINLEETEPEAAAQRADNAAKGDLVSSKSQGPGKVVRRLEASRTRLH